MRERYPLTLIKQLKIVIENSSYRVFAQLGITINKSKYNNFSTNHLQKFVSIHQIPTLGMVLKKHENEKFSKSEGYSLPFTSLRITTEIYCGRESKNFRYYGNIRGNDTAQKAAHVQFLSDKNILLEKYF